MGNEARRGGDTRSRASGSPCGFCPQGIDPFLPPKCHAINSQSVGRFKTFSTKDFALRFQEKNDSRNQGCSASRLRFGTRLLSSRRKQSSRCHCGIGARFHRFKQRAPFVAEGHVWISSSRRERCRIVEIYFHGVKPNRSAFISARRSVFGTKAI